ncbi:MAG TPA: hypothetical protein ENI23_16365 [bacterium]|nr:hypothetical protein [bacterium]
MKILYYAHSMITYGTRKEKQELKQIKKHFPDHRIINPAELRLFGISSYLEIVRQADIVVLSEYKKHIGKGVARELTIANEYDIEKYILRGKNFTRKFSFRVVDPDDWKIKYAKIVEI